MTYVSLDFETFSWADLKKGGQSRYAADLTTDALCLAWAIDNGPVHLWLPGERMPPRLRAAALAGVPFRAFNAKFEREIWEKVMVPYYRWPPIAPDQWYCTAVQAAHVNLPRNLDGAAKALELIEQKDKEGHRVMLWLSGPQGTAKRGRYRRHEPEKLQKLYDYCVQDVRTERAIANKLAPVPNRIRRIWHLDQKINRRGVPVDLDLCRGAVELLRQQHIVCNGRLQELSEGRIEKVSQRARVLDEIHRYHPDLPDLKAHTLDEWFTDERFADPVAVEIAHIRRNDGLASVKKPKAILDWADPDGRCRYTLKFLGAGPGRWSCGGPQFQNMARAKPPSDEAISAIASGDMNKALRFAKDGDLTGLVSQATRSIVCAPKGRVLVQSDFSAIEARLVAWVSGDEDQLARFHNGEDVYIALASKIYGTPPDQIDKESDERKVGKEAELGLGYRSAEHTFQRNLRNKWGMKLDIDLCRTVKEVYRESHQPIVNFWRDTENAAVMCLNRGKPVAVGGTGRPAIIFAPEGDWMTITLPSKRKLYYYKPYVAPSKFDKPSFWYFGCTNGKWGPKNAHGGVLTQNICEGMGFDLISSAMLRADEEGLDTVLTIHDSVFVEADEGDTETANLVHDIMSEQPDWSGGLPVKTETKTERRMQ